MNVVLVLGPSVGAILWCYRRESIFVSCLACKNHMIIIKGLEEKEDADINNSDHGEDGIQLLLS